MFDVIALGELLIDFAPKSVSENGYPVLAANPGGAPGNFLAALSKYGCSTAMIGKVGGDTFGRLLIGTPELRPAGSIRTRMCSPPLPLFRWTLPETGTSALLGSPAQIPV